jgi:F0F1-type ATP synthase membrane subunit a
MDGRNNLKHQIFIFGTRNLNYAQFNFTFLIFIWVHNVVGVVHVQSREVNTAHRNTSRSFVEWSLKLPDLKQN